MLQIDGAYNVTVYMKSQGTLEETDDGGERYRMHYVYIDQAAAFKCSSCGLCGNFKDRYNVSSERQEMELCDGSTASIGTGIDSETLENFDVNGWSWEYNFWSEECANYTDSDSIDYDITDNLGDAFNYTDSCDSRIQNTVQSLSLSLCTESK